MVLEIMAMPITMPEINVLDQRNNSIVHRVALVKVVDQRIDVVVINDINGELVFCLSCFEKKSVQKGQNQLGVRFVCSSSSSSSSIDLEIYVDFRLLVSPNKDQRKNQAIDSQQEFILMLLLFFNIKKRKKRSRELGYRGLERKRKRSLQYI